jgi:hypothetical protein
VRERSLGSQQGYLTDSERGFSNIVTINFRDISLKAIGNAYEDQHWFINLGREKAPSHVPVSQGVICACPWSIEFSTRLMEKCIFPMDPLRKQHSHSWTLNEKRLRPMAGTPLLKKGISASDQNHFKIPLAVDHSGTQKLREFTGLPPSPNPRLSTLRLAVTETQLLSYALKHAAGQNPPNTQCEMHSVMFPNR